MRQIFNSDAVERAKRNFGFNPNDATEIEKLTSEEVLTELQDSSDFLQKITFSTDIKNSGKVPVMRGSFPLNAWTGCDIIDEGTLSFEDVDITVSPLGFSESFCSRTLVGKWTAMGVATGLLNEMKSLPFEAQAKALALSALRSNILDVMVNGDTASLDPNLVHFDGYVKLIENDVNAVTYTGSIITASNAYAEFKGIARSFPAKVKESNKNLEIWCNSTNFDHLTDNLEDNNNFHYSAQVTGEGYNRELVLPSTGVKVCVKKGMADGSIVGVALENLVAGTDSSADMATVEVVPLVEARKMRLEAGAYIGVNIAFPEEFVNVTLS